MIKIEENECTRRENKGMDISELVEKAKERKGSLVIYHSVDGKPVGEPVGRYNFREEI
jgi:hypothetical protein